MTTLPTNAKKAGISIPLSQKQALRAFGALHEAGLCPAYRERQITSNGGKSVAAIPIAILASLYEANSPFRSAIASVAGASAALKRLLASRGSAELGPDGNGNYELRSAPKRATAAIEQASPT